MRVRLLQQTVLWLLLAPSAQAALTDPRLNDSSDVLGTNSLGADLHRGTNNFESGSDADSFLAAGRLPSATGNMPAFDAQRIRSVSGRTIDIGDLGGRRDATSDTAALIQAIAEAKANPGSIIRFGPGTWALDGIQYYYTIPSNTTLTGMGRNATVLTWNDAIANERNRIGLLGLDTSAGRPHNITLKDFTVVGSFATAGEATGGGYPIQADVGDHITIDNVGSVYSRAMGIVAQDDTDLTISNSYVAFSDRDGINTSQSSDISILNDVIEHTDDDCIATHSATGEVWNARQIVNITGNRCFDTSGIHAVGLRVGTISSNVIAQPKLHGIAIDTATATGAANRYAGEGYDSEIAIAITGNTITNVLDRSFIDHVNGGANYIVVTGSSARAGRFASVPGTPSANGIVPNPYMETFANTTSTGTPTPPSSGILVSGNIMQAYQPPTDGTDRRFKHYSDLGFGEVWTRTGYLNPKLPAEGTRDAVCVSIFGGLLRGVSISHNICSGVATALNVGDAVDVGDIDYSFNTNYDITDEAVLLNAGAAKGTIKLDYNDLDLDPFFLSRGRSSAHDGTWTSSGPYGVLQRVIGSGLNIIARGNVLKNAYADANVDTSKPPANWILTDNLVFADWHSLGRADPLNRGVGILRLDGGFRAVKMDSNPQSKTYGQILAAAQERETSLPVGGKYDDIPLTGNIHVRPGHGDAGWIKSTNVTDKIPIVIRTSAFQFDQEMDAVEVSNTNPIAYDAALPPCDASRIGIGYQIIKVDANTNPIVLTAADGNTISGAPFLRMDAQWMAVQVECNGAGTWLIGLR